MKMACILTYGGVPLTRERHSLPTSRKIIPPPKGYLMVTCRFMDFFPYRLCWGKIWWVRLPFLKKMGITWRMIWKRWFGLPNFMPWPYKSSGRVWPFKRPMMNWKPGLANVLLLWLRAMRILKREIDTRMQAEGSLRAFLDSIPEAAFLVEISGAVIMANNAFPDSFGIGKKQILGAHLSDLLPLEIMERRSIYVDEVLRTKEHQHYEEENNGKTIRHFIYPVHDSRGEVSRLADLCFDVTLQKQMERQLVQNEKLASIGFLVSGVAHEINNPNNFIIFNIPILRDYLNELTPITDKYALDHPDFEPVGMAYSEFREDLFKILENIEHGSTRINRTVSDLRDFSRKKEKTTHVPVDIKEVIEKAVSISRGKIGRMVKTLRMNVPEDMPGCILIRKSLNMS